MAAAGVLERDGARDCSAVLIASTLLVTAAHCVAGKVLAGAGGENRIRFHTGAYPGHRSEMREATEIMVHPLYRISSDEAKLGSDIAILRLEAPFPETVARPIPVAEPMRLNEKLLVATWPGGGGARARERICSPIRVSERVATLGCSVTPGESGGPVVRLTEAGPTLAGIVVARGDEGRQPLALVVQAGRQIAQIKALFQL
jgi:V8-like Glu-specific endopeptidase